MTATGWLWTFAAIHAVYGALQGYASGIGAEAPRWQAGAFLLSYLSVPYLWMRADARERGVPRGPTLSGLAIVLPWAAIPIYCWTSTAPGRRARALGRLALYGLLLVLAYLAGGAPIAWWLGGW